MLNDKVYVLSVWSTDGYDDFGKYVKVFRRKASVMKYVETYLDLEWHADGFGGECKDVYTLSTAEIL